MMFLSKMWTFFGIVLASVVQKTFTYTWPNLNCIDLNPQHRITMEQLSGTWFAVEIISHQPNEEYYNRTVVTCPIVHLSEDKTLTSTQHPLYGDYNNDTHNGSYDVNRYRNRNNGTSYQDERKYLRLSWDEDGNSTEYQLSYNITRPGFWSSSGPTSGGGLGSSVIPEMNNFSGTIQVIRAVNDHLVLTFCNTSPDGTVFTVILSKESYLDYSVIQVVHGFLNRKGLRTDNVKKTCDSTGKIDSTMGVSTVFLP